MIKNKFLWLIFLVLSMLIFSGCSSFSKKSDEKQSTENVINTELHQAQCDLLAKSNEEMAGINQKVRELNAKIQEKGKKLTDTENSALDDFEVKQTSINKRIHEIKNVKQEDWESFKVSFEKDMEDINTCIDSILTNF